MKIVKLSIITLLLQTSVCFSASLSGEYNETQTISEDSEVLAYNTYRVNLSSGQAISITNNATLTVRKNASLIIPGSSYSSGAGIYVTEGTFTVEENANIKVPRFVLGPIPNKAATLNLNSKVQNINGGAFGIAVTTETSTINANVSQNIAEWDVRTSFKLGFAEGVKLNFNDIKIKYVTNGHKNINVNLSNFNESNLIYISIGGEGGANNYEIINSDTGASLKVTGTITNAMDEYGPVGGYLHNETVTYAFVSEDSHTIINEVHDSSGNLKGFTISAIAKATVPEPAEWAMLLGTLALGLAIYRRRK